PPPALLQWRRPTRSRSGFRGTASDSVVTIWFVDAELFVGSADEVGLLRDLLAAHRAGAGGGCVVVGGAADDLWQWFPLRLMAECIGAARSPGGGVTDSGGGAFGGDAVLAEMERLLAAVDRLCAVSPVVLVAEDLQWADEASVLVWHRLSRAVGQLPLLLVGSSWPGTGREDLDRLRRGVADR